MPLPDGVVTVPLRSGTMLDASGNDYGVTMTVIPSQLLVWQATGDAVMTEPVQVSSKSGGVEIDLPATDQTGFVTPAGTLVETGWTYTVILAAPGADTQIRVVALPSTTDTAVDLTAAVGVTTTDPFALAGSTATVDTTTSFANLITN